MNCLCTWQPSSQVIISYEVRVSEGNLTKKNSTHRLYRDVPAHPPCHAGICDNSDISGVAFNAAQFPNDGILTAEALASALVSRGQRALTIDEDGDTLR